MHVFRCPICNSHRKMVKDNQQATSSCYLQQITQKDEKQQKVGNTKGKGYYNNHIKF